MPAKRKKRSHQFKMRSHRQLRQTLLAFGIAGLTLGLGLMIFYGLKRDVKLASVGLIYVLVALSLLGIRGVLNHIAEVNRHRRFKSQTRKARQA